MKSDYSRKLATYKLEFDRVSAERARLVKEYEAKLKDIGNVESAIRLLKINMLWI